MTVLGDIMNYKRKEVAFARDRIPDIEIEERARETPPVRNFRAALEAARAASRYGLIAEIKKASPSKGLIRADFDPGTLATDYENGGATCLSVLTDGPSFQGAPEYLTTARANSSLPLLRKDFLFEPYQVTEARAWGADCILVIMAAVTDDEAFALVDAAGKWKLDVLVEVHNETELDRALALDADFIGINNRDLNTFATDINVTLRLAPRIPDHVLVVAESGLSEPEHLAQLAEAGVTTFLIGESLMRQADVMAATRRLIGSGTKR
ncbi:MAG TPA: indole-3-glycerol phosphate synthase TrpC [Rhizomicrobium sp.]|nr:indole-3-glycerol phosphate synthase TrpC [Rhizomicrobium sp.]